MSHSFFDSIGLLDDDDDDDNVSGNFVAHTSPSDYNNSHEYIESHVVVQNIRSMRENIDLFFSEICVLPILPKLIFLTEIWIYENEICNYNVDNFVLYSACNENYRAGGVCVYAHKDFVCDVESINLSSADIIRVDTTINKEKFTFVCLYRIQSINVYEFLADLTRYLGNIKCSNLFVVGDMNIDLIELNSISSNYLFTMSSFGLLSNVNCITRPSSGTCIDHIFSRIGPGSNVVVNYRVEDKQITDHSMLFIQFTYSSAHIINTIAPNIEYAQVDYELLNARLDFEQWDGVYSTNDVVNALNIFIATLNAHIIDCKKLIKKSTARNRKLKPWMTDKLCGKILKKNFLLKKLKKHPNNLKLKAYVKSLSKCIVFDVNNSKEKYYLKKFQSNGNDHKKNWKLVSEILTNSCSTVHSIDKIVDSEANKILDNQYDIATSFNNYFVDAVVDLKRLLPDSNNTFPNDNSTLTFFIEPVLPEDIVLIINGLENKLSVDIMGFSNRMFKFIKHNVSRVLAYIINLSFEQGCVPDILKSATVLPLLKKGDPTLKQNYRPISILPIISKILEKCMKVRMLSFFHKINFFSNCQFGFREKLNTENALLEFLNYIYTFLHNKSKVCGLFVDIKKAFDMVDHNKLLQKLQDIGLRGKSYLWFSSYLSNRYQRVKIGEKFSDYKCLDVGVPQGSVLGPILFLVYINSLFSIDFSGKLVAFADDMAFAYAASSDTILNSQVNNDLTLLANYFNQHSLILSEKTKLMYFGITQPAMTGISEIFYHTPTCDNISCSNLCVNIEMVDNFRYLGLILDNNLNWKKHVRSITNYSCRVLRQFYLLRKHCPFNILKNLYFALYQSKLQYGLICWGGSYESTLKPLLTIQKFIVRTINFKSRITPSWPLFCDNRIFPLRHLYVYRVLRLFFIRGGNRFIKILKLHNIRANVKHLCVVPSAKTEHFRRFYFSTGPRLFNSLPLEIRSCSHANEFLCKLKNWLFDTPDAGSF